MADNCRLNSNMECQYFSLKSISAGDADMPSQSVMRLLKVLLRRHLTVNQDRMLHVYANKLLCLPALLRNTESFPKTAITIGNTEELKKGDLVRVRSKEEIHSTLNHLGQLKGCTFMQGMTSYCGTLQRVLKPMNRFVDERDLRVKRCSGLVLLDGVMCQGTTEFGQCDRSCLFFWRREWLEKI